MAAPAPKDVTATWQGRGLVFHGTAPGRAPITLDGDNREGPGPMENLLLALAACTGSDVVEVAKKKRLDLRELRLEVHGERRAEFPRRYTRIRIVYRVKAPGATEQAIRHAIDLSLQKYCSVTHSLHQDIAVEHELDLQA
jgi:putative redox protein